MTPRIGLLALSIAGSLATCALGATTPSHLEGQAFDRPLVVEVVGSGDAGPALQAAVAEVAEIDRLADPEGGGAGVAAVAGAAGEPVSVDPRLAALLSRAEDFCRWSGGAHGPLGGWLYGLWGMRQPVGALPTPEVIRQGAQLASCDHLKVDTEAHTVRVDRESRLDLRGFAPGFAVDQAVQMLADHGFSDASVTLGRIQRATGSGPSGTGWPLRFPQTELLEDVLHGLFLRDRAVAVALAEPRVTVAGESFAPHLDQRTGRPVSGVLGVVAVSRLALDAQGLAGSMFVVGNREGTHLLGLLRPTPSVVWLLGSGEGPPLITDFHWSAARQP